MTRLEQLRFQRLTRHFVHNFFDNELLAPAGEASKVFVAAFALLGALGFTLSLLYALKYTYVLFGAKPEVRAWAGASDNLLMVLLTMSLMGLLVALTWDGMLPSRRDGHILGALPVKHGEIFRARLLATVLVFTLVLGAFAVFPGLVLPCAQSNGGDWLGLGRRFLAQLVSVVAAGGFVFFGAIALQSLLMAILPYPVFLRVSNAVQLAVLVSSFALLFLTPGIETAHRLGWNWVVYLPPYWFLGVWQILGQGLWPYGPGPLLAALAATAPVAGLSILLTALLHGRAMKKAVEGTPLAPRGPGLPQRALAAFLNALLLRDPRVRAVFWFAFRTLMRYPSHRLLLAIYFGLGLSWVLAGLSSMLTSGAAMRALQPSAALCTIPADLAAMLLIGMRVLFGMPVEVKANWMARISAPESGEFAAQAARKLMVMAGILPMAAAPLPFMAAAWGWQAAAIHLWLYLLETALLLELLMGRFHKFPFACSWLPGQANLKVKLGMYFILFAATSSFLGSLEAHVLTKHSAATLISMSIVLGGWLAWLLWRRRGEESPRLRFDEQPEFGICALQLQ